MAENQLLLSFPESSKMDAENFIVLPSNYLAYQATLNCALDDSLGVVLYGEKGTGKSHLSHIFADKNTARILHSPYREEGEHGFEKTYIVENIHQATAEDQEYIFHVFNHVKSVGGKLLVTSLHPIAQLDDFLPDLKSRLLTLPQMELQKPDDNQLEVLFVKFAADYQLYMEPAVMRYILSRCARDIHTLRCVMKELNEISLREKRKLTIPFVKSFMNSFTA